jgi:hypothetical protein
MNDKYYKQIIEQSEHALSELAYEGNIGFIEVFNFFKVATPEQKVEFDRLCELNELKAAWELIQTTVGVRLHGLD